MFELTKLPIFTTKWLSDPNAAVISTVIVAVWQAAGYIMVIYIAGLQSIDTSQIEASLIDGANSWQRFRYMTIPLLMPSITVNLFMSTTQAFRVFDLNLVLTDGGPGYATTSMALDIYKTAFSMNRMGYGAAKAVILFFIAFCITIVQVRFTKKREVQS